MSFTVWLQYNIAAYITCVKTGFIPEWLGVVSDGVHPRGWTLQQMNYDSVHLCLNKQKIAVLRIG